MRPPDEHSTIDAHPELVFTIEYVSTNLKRAEDYAFKIGGLLSSIASAYGGYPLGVPHLHKIASVDFEGKMMSQHNYLYIQKPYMLLNFDQTVEHGFLSFLKAVSSNEGQTKHRLQSAIHWYGISISSDEPSVSYVAAWTGLESIASSIDRKWHTNGPKAPCQICGNVAGKERSHKMAGLDHIFEVLAQSLSFASFSKESKELLSEDVIEGFTHEQASRLRDNVVHGLKEVEGLVQQCSKFRRHLMHTLNLSIQLCLEPSTKSWITGDFEFHPIERASIRCKEIVNKAPYYDEWFDDPASHTQSTVHERGRLLTAKFAMEWELDKRMIELIAKEGFKRDTDVFSSDGSEVLNFPKWHDRPVEPPWKDVAEFSDEK